jgi:hypothetical protein
MLRTRLWRKLVVRAHDLMPDITTFSIELKHTYSRSHYIRLLKFRLSIEASETKAQVHHQPPRYPHQPHTGRIGQSPLLLFLESKHSKVRSNRAKFSAQSLCRRTSCFFRTQFSDFMTCARSDSQEFGDVTRASHNFFVCMGGRLFHQQTANLASCFVPCAADPRKNKQ